MEIQHRVSTARVWGPQGNIALDCLLVVWASCLVGAQTTGFLCSRGMGSVWAAGAATAEMHSVKFTSANAAHMYTLQVRPNIRVR